MSYNSNSNIGAEAATAVDQKIQEFRILQEELTKHHTDLGTLMAQRNENEMVKQELEVCEREGNDGNEAVIYKQVGPVLIKNDLDEALETVRKRLEFISGEMKKTEQLIEKKEKQSQELATKIQEMQGAMQRAAAEAAKAMAAQQYQQVS
eukprot:CAMPEP_0171337612 /NCGR_PEP_ID=MMETSP0878-20121228/6794_1 /TAXON_ID=67004 /ORGANISM="Thalassiosira weissflogii, Strain CCMP1336" /LENGTH=149 /DNA_ID=CAMNT_0011839255 /DNA_START=77 /DNA_END=526 /DNA_ORIENTATION=-